MQGQGRRTFAVVLALFALALISAAPAGANALKTCNGLKSLCSRHFNQVVLPATHNSMSAASLGFAVLTRLLP